MILSLAVAIVGLVLVSFGSGRTATAGACVLTGSTAAVLLQVGGWVSVQVSQIGG